MNIESIQQICKSLPSITQDIKWGDDLVFSIGGKMFFIVVLNQVPVMATFKVTEEHFDEMCERDGFKQAAYVGKYKWVTIDDIGKMNKKEWEKFITQSYNLVKGKLSTKIRKQLGE